MARILAIDDNLSILKVIKNALQLKAHEVIVLESVSGVSIEDFCGYDLILLDVMMPEVDGFELCRKIRDSVDCPILFLTAKTEEAAIVQGLMSGGDDYITKPFGIMELNARVEAHLRRENRDRSTHKATSGDIVFDFDKKEVRVKGELLDLTKNEYLICEYLMTHRSKVYTKEEIFEAVYDYDSDTQIKVISEFIRVIRKKFKIYDCYPIETVWGVGYIWK